MKIKLLVAAAATVVASSAMAQSAFQGFYGQVATGYESNSITGLGSSYSYLTSGNFAGTGTTSASNQNANGMPLVIGLGYNFKIDNAWLLGLGVDYSALSQESSSYSGTNSLNSSGSTGNKQKVQDRYNIFVSPAYAIDKDKLAYLKVGYSAETIKYSSPAQGTTPALSTSNNVSGYILGLGYKQMISGGFYGFAEGNYMSYGKVNAGTSWTETNGTRVTTTTNTGSSAYTLLVGVGYKF